MTVEEYYAATVEIDLPTQLIDGELVVNHPSPLHGVLQVRIAGAFRRMDKSRIRTRPRGDADRRGPRRLRRLRPRPSSGSLSVTSRSTFASASSASRTSASEVRSPSTWRYDVGREKSVYEDAGLPELWLVDDHAETVMVFRRTGRAQTGFDVALELGAAETVTSPQLPGFSLPIDDLFAAA